MKHNEKTIFKCGIVIAFLTLFLASILGSVLNIIPTTNLNHEQNATLQFLQTNDSPPITTMSPNSGWVSPSTIFTLSPTGAKSTAWTAGSEKNDMDFAGGTAGNDVSTITNWTDISTGGCYLHLANWPQANSPSNYTGNTGSGYNKLCCYDYDQSGSDHADGQYLVPGNIPATGWAWISWEIQPGPNTNCYGLAVWTPGCTISIGMRFWENNSILIDMYCSNTRPNSCVTWTQGSDYFIRQYFNLATHQSYWSLNGTVYNNNGNYWPFENNVGVSGGHISPAAWNAGIGNCYYDNIDFSWVHTFPNSTWNTASSPYQFTLGSELTDGSTVRIGYNSTAYNGSVEATHFAYVQYDKSAPTTSFSYMSAISGNSTNYIAEATRITLSSSDSGSGVSYTEMKIGTNPWYLAQTSSFKLSNFTDGSYQIQLYSVDNVGNVGEITSFTVILNKMILIRVDSPMNGASFNSSIVSLNVSVLTFHLDSIWYVLDGATPVKMPVNTSISVSDGFHVIVFYANNTSGNTNVLTISFEVNTKESSPKPPIIIIIIIIIIGASVGITTVTYFEVRVKKVKTGMATSKKSDTSYSQVSGSSIDQSVAAFNKRARLMQTNLEMAEFPKKAKLSASTEPEVDINARVASARDMESQVNVMPVVAKCIVHKGPITGFSYTCKHCGVPYCMDCYNHLVAAGEKCWNCGNAIESNAAINGNQQGLIVDEFHGVSTLFNPEIIEKIRNLALPGDVQQDLLRVLKEIPPEQRLQYLEDTFTEEIPDEESF